MTTVVPVLEQVDAETRAILDRFGFDAERFGQLQERVAAGSLSPESNVVRGAIEPLGEGGTVPLPAPGDRRYDEARAAGLEALAAGQVGMAVLNGGMATRFGGVVKGAVPAVDGRSFLEIKLAETERLAKALGTTIPAAVMTSFATDEATRSFLAARDGIEPFVFAQFVSLRLEPDGSLFRAADGSASPYGPGHGDVLETMRSSGTLERLSSLGVRHVQVSNVDNLGARIDPVVVGAHLLGRRPLTSETARKDGDMGGAPARVDGRPMLLESYRFPEGFDQSEIPVFNTNTAWLSVDALDRAYELSWLYVEKEVDGRRAVQLERLYHEVSAFLETTYLVVPRAGPRGRFFPIKTPADLESAQPGLRELLAAPPLD